jgi:hypothetical protein
MKIKIAGSWFEVNLGKSSQDPASKTSEEWWFMHVIPAGEGKAFV